VPDALLDVVKEEQTRAREAGKSSRGGTHTGGAGRGASRPHLPCHLFAHRGCTLTGRSGAPQRGLAFALPRFSILRDHAETFRRFFQVAVVHAVDQRAGVGHAGAACDIANMPECVCPRLFSFSVTFVIVEVMVPVVVTGVGDDTIIRLVEALRDWITDNGELTTD